MSQTEVMIILDELGRRATNKAIVNKAKEKFPGLSLHQYVGLRLWKMKEHGYVGFDSKSREWYIIDDSLITERSVIV